MRELISVCIPTYEMHGLGHDFLKHSFDILYQQTFKDFNVIISDHSKNDLIKNLCTIYSEKLNIHYYKNTEHVGNSSANINNAIKHATGKLIKILFQDDFLYNKDSLEVIAKNFDIEKDTWLVTACEHSVDGITFTRQFYPKYHDKIYLGNNTISSPSVLTIKNSNPLLFAEELIWLMDCEYYKRCFDKFGLPKIVNTITVVNRLGKHQISNTTATVELKQKEQRYVAAKYHKSLITRLKALFP
jgi:hypothetical protein